MASRPVFGGPIQPQPPRQREKVDPKVVDAADRAQGAFPELQQPYNHPNEASFVFGSRSVSRGLAGRDPMPGLPERGAAAVFNARFSQPAQQVQRSGFGGAAAAKEEVDQDPLQAPRVSGHSPDVQQVRMRRFQSPEGRPLPLPPEREPVAHE